MYINKLLVILCLASLFHAQPFLYSQGLTVFSSFSETCDVSGDN